jgi:hypothetical protein
MVAILLIVAGLLVFIDFWIGERAQRQLKDLLVDVYVYIAEGSWWDFLGTTARFTDQALSRWFGYRIWSGSTLVRYALFSLVFNAIMGLVVFAAETNVDVASSYLAWGLFWFLLYFICFLNAFADTIIASITRQVVRSIAHSPPPLAFAWLCALALIAYFAMATLVAFTAPSAMIFILRGMSDVNVYSAKDWESWKALFFLWVPTAFAHPWSSSLSFGIGSNSAERRLIVGSNLFDNTSGLFNVFYFTISAIIPTLLQFGLLFVTGVVAILRPVLQQPIALLLQRLEAHKLGVLTLVGGAVGSIAGVVKALS